MHVRNAISRDVETHTGSGEVSPARQSDGEWGGWWTLLAKVCRRFVFSNIVRR